MSSCELSPQAHAFSTVLTAFIGSVINGLCNGALIAFVTGWIAWLSVIRILIASLFEYWQTFKAGTQIKETEYETLQLPKTTGDFTAEMPFNIKLERGILQQVNFTGWLGWIWSAIYTPVSQTIWLFVNVKTSSGGVAIARAIAIGVSALGLTFDNKQRYAAVLGRKLGSWAFVTFNLWNATACLLLGVECAFLLIHGALEVQPPIPVYVAYPIFACIWAGVSFKFLPIINGSRKGVNIFVDVLVGAFAGLFVAAPAILIWRNAAFAAKVANMRGTASDGLDLGEYLRCQGTTFWDKFAAIMP